jgi:hypothetical protein
VNISSIFRNFEIKPYSAENDLDNFINLNINSMVTYENSFQNIKKKRYAIAYNVTDENFNY